jgi:uncharacterized membrane protein YoaK (UPF0700 family)
MKYLNSISGKLFIISSTFFFFLFGAFASNFMAESIARKNENFVFIIPTIIESLILLAIAVLGHDFINTNPNVIACSMLFAMGLQNSLVTKISNATVRTTHLTGLFTDLGIELSQLFFYKQPRSRVKLFSSIKLRLTIISFFFIGGITGGVFYSKIGLYVLIIASVTLQVGLIYDYIKSKLILLKQKKSLK